jgi:hypothetical protein
MEYFAGLDISMTEAYNSSASTPCWSIRSLAAQKILV